VPCARTYGASSRQPSQVDSIQESAPILTVRGWKATHVAASPAVARGSDSRRILESDEVHIPFPKVVDGIHHSHKARTSVPAVRRRLAASPDELPVARDCDERALDIWSAASGRLLERATDIERRVTSTALSDTADSSRAGPWTGRCASGRSSDAARKALAEGQPGVGDRSLGSTCGVRSG
jgi:hypothetical protein